MLILNLLVFGVVFGGGGKATVELTFDILTTKGKFYLFYKACS